MISVATPARALAISTLLVKVNTVTAPLHRESVVSVARFLWARGILALIHGYKEWGF